MKTDGLEEFIEANRAAFDHYEPSPEVWTHISQNSKKSKAIKLGSNILKVAAFVALAFVLSVLIVKNDRFKTEITQTEIIDPEMIELIESEAFYAGKVNEKMKIIEKCYDTFPEIKNDVETDLNELKKMYNTLKIDLNENVSKKEVIEAMIENNRHRLKVVDEVLEQINC